jgi:hypothetical protein
VDYGVLSSRAKAKLSIDLPLIAVRPEENSVEVAGQEPIYHAR